MANLKNITDLPVAESAEGLNLIVNDNGSAKQIAASAVGAQADWAVTDENSPAFIKNKPVEEWDLDLNIIISYDADSDGMVPIHTINHIIDFTAFKEKIVSGINPKLKISCQDQPAEAVDAPYIYCIPPVNVSVFPAGFSPFNETQEAIFLEINTIFRSLIFLLLEDGSTNLINPN